MNNIEIKVTIKEETKKTRVYDFTESIKALEKAQAMSAAIITEANEAICNAGMQSFERWIERLHKELQPVLDNHGVMQLIQKRVYFGYAEFKTVINAPHKDEFALILYHNNGLTMKVRFLSTHYEIDAWCSDPEVELERFSENVEFVHKTIMNNITSAIREAKETAQRRAEKRVRTLENMLNM